MPTARDISLGVDPYGHPQHAKEQKNFLCICINVKCVYVGVGGPTNRQNNMNTHQKTILASETRKKRINTPFRHDKIIFFKSVLMNIHATHHIYRIALRKKWF
jgi:hypothetical protein